MEKSVAIQLTEQQQQALTSALGFPFDRVMVRVSYVASAEDQARSKGEMIATLPQNAGAGQVWIVDGIQVVPQSAGQDLAFQLDLGSVTGGGPQGSPSDKDAPSRR